ncbi:hypothetical protein [Actinocatenispora rupis]|uniref:Uncharacterized protein n=1 Tax=Actinocatenispora rupis TaxID=519421 RepID=A0A8J3JFM7_9ACTN|nr:hypothetical protein [Actinocatenispora rupis]GID14013.1 hypothetical protein Aru02nite_49020 [Actinocatenispora rupis]
MYGVPYATGPAPTPPAGRPTPLLIGMAGTFVTILATLAETAFEVLMFNDFSTGINDSTGTATTALRPYLITTILMNLLVSIGLGIGAALLMRQKNAGRIVLWCTGGVCVLVRLCCLSGLGMFGLVVNELNNSASSSQDSIGDIARGWVVAGAAVSGSLALIAVVAAMIAIIMPAVGRWIRGAASTAPQAPAAPYRPYGY